MRVAFSTEARSDIRSIATFIATDNPVRAVRFISEVEAACLGLGAHPQRFALLPGFERLEYRRRPIASYAIIYAVGESITIIRVLHSAMDLAAALGD